MTTFPYLLTTSLYMALFYGCYRLFLRRNTFFNLNRVYLLASIGLSLVLPCVELPVTSTVSLPVSRITLPTVVVSNQLMTESGGWSVLEILGLFYIVGVGIMALRLSLTIQSVFRIIRRGSVEQEDTHTIIRLPNEEISNIPSFSFGRYLVLNHSDGLTPLPALLRHEEAHIRQFHTVDILFLEIVRAFFWFNPVLWFYKIALQEVHEFLADRAAVHQLSTADFLGTQAEVQPTYAHQVVAYALNVPINELIAPFASASTLKQRICMLQKPLTHRRSLLRYVLVLPFVACLLMCTQAETDLPLDAGTLISNGTVTHKSVKVDGEVFTVVEQQPEFPGGMKQLTKYLGDNLRYPASAQKVNAEGRVFVSFVVTKTGEISDVKLLKGIGFGADEEAVRVVSQMPRWIPARQNGQLVNVRFNLPINFQIDDDQRNEQVRNDFWKHMAKYKTYTLDGEKIDKSSMRTVANQALKENVQISFSIYNKTSTVAFTHAD